MSGLVYGLLGQRLSHSYSVPIHEALGRRGYRLIELEPEELEGFLSRDDIGGLNVTIPYKRTVMPLCAGLSDAARAIGCVNTIVRMPDGRLFGHNTDAYGLEYMAKRAGISFADRKTVIFGSGGASLTARSVAKAGGASEVIVVSRSGVDNYVNLSRHRDADILINATPVGMYPENGKMPADPALFPSCRGVLDLIYNPRRTALLMRAKELGIPCTDGLPMLVAQALAAEELFSGGRIDEGENERVLALIRREVQNVVLIGMPGSGKTTVGKALGRLTGREVVDVDAMIVRTAGKAIPDIFAERGEAYFRELERAETARAGALSGRIIVTGGGVVKDPCNLPALRQNGRLYQILRDTALLGRDGRPLSKNADLDAMALERAPMYAAFRDAAVENAAAPEDAAARIWRDFCENTGD